MKSTIFGFNQNEAISLKLDLKDLLLLSWIRDFFPRMQKKEIEGESYGWINYEYMIENIPVIEINNPRSLARRLDGLVEKQLLKKKVVKNKTGTYTYFLPTPLVSDLMSKKDFLIEQKPQLVRSAQDNQEQPTVLKSTTISTGLESTTKDSSINNSSINNRKKEIVPPDIEEARKYHSEKGYKFDLEEWFYYYESRGWMIGKNKIKSWKATMKTWDINDKKKNKSYQSNPIKHDWGANIQYKSPEELKKEELERQKFWDDYYEKERKEKGITGC